MLKKKCKAISSFNEDSRAFGSEPTTDAPLTDYNFLPITDYKILPITQKAEAEAEAEAKAKETYCKF